MWSLRPHGLGELLKGIDNSALPLRNRVPELLLPLPHGKASFDVLSVAGHAVEDLVVNFGLDIIHSPLGLSDDGLTLGHDVFEARKEEELRGGLRGGLSARCTHSIRPALPSCPWRP